MTPFFGLYVHKRARGLVSLFFSLEPLDFDLAAEAALGERREE